MKKTNLTLVGLGFVLCLCAQEYTSYLIGNDMDAIAIPGGGVCLMGGGNQNDFAFRWFLEGAQGGDILVLSTSGADEYNDYLFSELGVNVHSVETIRFNAVSATNNTYILQQIANAEAIWITAGNQWDYISFWKNTPVSAAINAAIAQRNIMIGGTGAGMSILGGTYFTAQNGEISSIEAMSNPYASNMTLDSADFLSISLLSNVITDTHYLNPDRRGRHIAFLAKARTDYDQNYFGIACDEFTAVCINSQGIAKVFGTYPDYDDTAYFLVPNCEIPNNQPEQCIADQVLEWNHNGAAIKTYAVKGTPTGLYSLDLNNWVNGVGGDWENWSITNNQFNSEVGATPNCTPLRVEKEVLDFNIKPIPNPTNRPWFSLDLPKGIEFQVRLYGINGQFLKQWDNLSGYAQLFWEFPIAGVYSVEVFSQAGGRSVSQLVVR